MKNTYPIIMILLLFTISPVDAELTVPDLEKIDEKIRESNNDLKEHIDKRFGHIDKRFDNLKEHTDSRFSHIENKFNDIEREFDRMSMLYLGLLGGVIALALTPIGFLWWYVKRGESFLSELRHSTEESIEISKKILEEDREYANDMKKHIDDVIKSYEEFVNNWREIVEDFKKLYSEELEKIQKS